MTTATLDPRGVVEALENVASVLSDHAAALDRLELGDSWDDAAAGSQDGTTPGASGGAATGGRVGSGSDLARTIAAAVEAVGDSAAKGMAAVAEALQRGAEQGAAGAAGHGFATLLGGLTEVLRNADRLDARSFAIGLEVGAERLAPSDDGKHAGCLPAVAAASADGALAALDAGAGLADVVIAAADDGLVELEKGPHANPKLVERGVVDATAAGYLLVLDVLASVLTGEPLPAPPMDPHEQRAGDDGSRPTSRYEVRCRVEPNEGCGIDSANWLESTWYELGEVVEFEAFQDPWRLAVHTARPGAAIEALLEVGRPRDLHVGLVPADT